MCWNTYDAFNFPSKTLQLQDPHSPAKLADCLNADTNTGATAESMEDVEQYHKDEEKMTLSNQSANQSMNK